MCVCSFCKLEPVIYLRVSYAFLPILFCFLVVSTIAWKDSSPQWDVTRKIILLIQSARHEIFIDLKVL